MSKFPNYVIPVALVTGGVLVGAATVRDFNVQEINRDNLAYANFPIAQVSESAEAPTEEAEAGSEGETEMAAEAEAEAEGETEMAAEAEAEAEGETEMAAEAAESEAEETAEAEAAAEGDADAEEVASEDVADPAESTVEEDAIETAATETSGEQPAEEQAAAEETSAEGERMAMAASSGTFGLGRQALPEEIAAWDIDIRPDGAGLPAGSGSVGDGEQLYIDYCSSCHGVFGEGMGRWPVLAGGEDTLSSDDPVKTPGSYWPYLSTVYDYIHRAMPFGNAQSLNDDEVYALTAYVLYLNFLVEDDFVLTNENFTEVAMPNEEGFYLDDRAETELTEFSEDVCMENCKDEVEITMRARVLDVTPESGDASAAMEEAAVEATEQPSTMVESAAEVGTEGAGDETEVPTEMAQTKAEGEGEQMAQADQAPSEQPTETATATETEEAATQEVAEATDAAETEEAPAETEEVAMAAPDPELVAAGEKVFRKCQACHQVGDGAQNRVGPVLTGVVGATVGSVEDFNYSSVFQELHEAGTVWTPEELSAFLEDPRGYAKGTRMSFSGLRAEEDRDAIIAYLSTFE